MSELPGPMTPTTTPTIAGLYAETFAPSGTAKGVVVITHGYAEHAGRYREVAHVIVNAGWAAITYDVRGHGKSPGKRGAIDHFDTYLHDLAAIIAGSKSLAPAGAPLILLGHSHGSLITLRALAGDNPPAPKAVIVASPYLGLRLHVPGWKKTMAKIVGRIAPNLNQPNNIRSEQLTNDKAKQAEHAADKVNFPTATIGWFLESAAAQHYVYEHADRIKVPTTWLVGADDPIADPARSRQVADKVKGATYHDLVGMKHEVFNEVDRASVYAKLTDALAKA